MSAQPASQDELKEKGNEEKVSSMKANTQLNNDNACVQEQCGRESLHTMGNHHHRVTKMPYQVEEDVEEEAVAAVFVPSSTLTFHALFKC